MLSKQVFNEVYTRGQLLMSQETGKSGARVLTLPLSWFSPSVKKGPFGRGSRKRRGKVPQIILWMAFFLPVPDKSGNCVIGSWEWQQRQSTLRRAAGRILVLFVDMA